MASFDRAATATLESIEVAPELATWPENEAIPDTLDSDDDDDDELPPDLPSLDESNDAISPILPSTPVPPASRKRKRRASGRGSRKQPIEPSQLRKLVYTQASQEKVMQLFLEESRRRSFAIEKVAVTRPAFIRISKQMEQHFPAYPWSADKIKEKYTNEKRRYRAWLTFTAISGTGYNAETGLVEAGDTTWEQYLAKYPKNGWLQTIPLGNPELYAEVFHREKATGQYIRTASDLLPSLTFHRHESLDGNSSSTDDPDKDPVFDGPTLNIETVDEALSQAESVPATPRRSSFSIDPDHTAKEGSPSVGYCACCFLFGRGSVNVSTE